MKRLALNFFICFPVVKYAQKSSERTIIDLNGTWQFEQTLHAFPPAKFTRSITVPGLVHMARPSIDDYHKFFLSMQISKRTVRLIQY